MTDETRPFARVVPTDGRYYKVGGVIAKPSAPQDAEGDVRAINAAHESRCQARERRAAVKALREAAEGADCFHADAMESLGHHDGTLSDATRQRIAKWLRARAAAIERGEVAP